MESGKVAHRPFVPRRQHTKSRGACTSCRRRKVKCSETRPSCELCSGKGLVCEYPGPQKLHRVQKIHAAFYAGPHSLHAPLTSFKMSDLRLFHHFLLNASPHHPIGNEMVWVQEIPALAHQYDFLMHAMLALAASNLTAISAGDFSRAAISHRIHAVNGLKGVLGKQFSSACDADAMLAAFYIFGFQSLYIDDGLVDFLIMIRGCSLVSGQIQAEGLATVFQFPELERYVSGAETEAGTLPCVGFGLAMAASTSLEALQPLCTHEVERIVLDMLSNIVAYMHSSSVQEAYLQVMILYATIAELSPRDFMYFIDPTNETMQILLGHFVAVHVLAGPLIVQEGFRSRKLMGAQRTGKWLDGIIAAVGAELLRFLEWPMAVVRMDALSGLWSSPQPPYLATCL